MAAYAFYRHPYSDTYTEVVQTSGEPEELFSFDGLNGRCGFVLAPFEPAPGRPVLLIRADRSESHVVERETVVAGLQPRSAAVEETCRADYAADFSACHSRLVSGEFSKIVLARCVCELTKRSVAPRELFLRACRLYPRMFVALVFTERGGVWLTATPEILLGGRGGEWRTVALAGTMRLEGDTLGFDNPPSESVAVPSTTICWDDKNIQEQRYVATYIEDSLARFAYDVRQTPPHTVRAGGVVHLRSDFTFSLDSSGKLGDLLSELHPTPAVCGLPKSATYRFIVGNEHSPRDYYSGFMGPLCHDGDTSLYVSLRCMRVCADRCFLYAGGGLLSDSVEQTEWNETEAKLETMRRVLADDC